MIVDDVNANDWVNKADEKKTKKQLDQNTQQNYNEIAGKMIWAKNADLVSQMVSKNKIRVLLILKKITSQKENESEQSAEKNQPDLDIYLHDDNELLELTETNDDVVLRLSLKRRRSKSIEELNQKPKRVVKIKKRSPKSYLKNKKDNKR